MSRRSTSGYEILGGDDGGQALVIRVRDISRLVKDQGGLSGMLALPLIPQTVASSVYGKMRDSLLAGFKDKGVDAEVSIVASPVLGPPRKADFITGAVVGAAGIGICAVLWSFVVKHFVKG